MEWMNSSKSNTCASAELPASARPSIVAYGHGIRPGQRLAPYIAPGARAWALLVISALENLSSTDLDKRIPRQCHHPGRTIPLGLPVGRRPALRTEGLVCLGFPAESPEYPGPW